MPAAPSHPYKGLPPYNFWKQAVAIVELNDFDPVICTPFKIDRTQPVAAAGSCFAQHIARHLVKSGFNFLQMEPPATHDEPVFSARFGNIYTIRQLRQLLLRAYGLYRPADAAWLDKNGRYLDPFRPQMPSGGYATVDEVDTARAAHLLAVRDVFEKCSVFIFTLGLTEAWLSADGAALPVPPGVVAIDANSDRYEFHNFTVSEMIDEMTQFLTDLRSLNSAVQIILTVSPVPLVATYEDRHVLVSNTYSKAALRVVAEEIARSHDFVAYFPSYEIITSPLARSKYFEADLRSISEAGVTTVMSIFSEHFLIRNDTNAEPSPNLEGEPTPGSTPPGDSIELGEAIRVRFEEIQTLLCDEELLQPRAEV